MSLNWAGEMSEGAQSSYGSERLRPLHLLLVEDNPADVLIFREALKEIGLLHTVDVARDGQEALDLLTAVDESVRLRPDVIVLDLNLPRLTGLELLGRLKEDAELRSIPTIVLSGSHASSDVKKAYHLHANSYVRKAMTFEDSIRVLRTLEAFWCQTAVLPPDR